MKKTSLYKRHVELGAKLVDTISLEARFNDLLVRTTGDIIALSPPLIIEKNQIDEIIEKLSNVLKSI